MLRIAVPKRKIRSRNQGALGQSNRTCITRVIKTIYVVVSLSDVGIGQ